MNNSPVVLITSPSLNVFENVSGISSLVSEIIARSNSKIIHFEVASKDGQSKDLRWLYNQLVMYVKIIYACLHRNIDIIHLNVGLEAMGIMRDYLLMIIVKVVFKKKLLLHLHGGYYLMNEPTNRVLASMLKALIFNADLIIVLSELERQTLINRYGARNFYALPNAVECPPPAQPNKPANGQANGVLKLVFVGRINQTKGIFVLSEAFKYLGAYYDRFTFDIYGAGPDLPQLLAKLAEYPCLRYAYRGVAKEKWQILHEADVMLLPSVHSEGMPMVILESMAAGCLVISTDDASIGTVIKDGLNGLIVPKSDPRALAAKIKAVIDNQVDRFGLAAKAQSLIAEHYAMSQYMVKLQAVYKQIMLPAAVPHPAETA